MSSADDASEPKDLRRGDLGRMAAARLNLHDSQRKKLTSPQQVVDVAETVDLRKRPEGVDGPSVPERSVEHLSL